MYHMNYLTISKPDNTNDVHLISDETSTEIIDILNKGGYVAVLDVDEPEKAGEKIISRTINLKNFVSINKVLLTSSHKNPDKIHEEMANLFVNGYAEVEKKARFKTGAGDWSEKLIKEKRGNRIAFYANNTEDSQTMYHTVLTYLEENYGNSLSNFVRNMYPSPTISFDGIGIEPAVIHFLVFSVNEYSKNKKQYDYTFFQQ